MAKKIGMKINENIMAAAMKKMKAKIEMASESNMKA